MSSARVVSTVAIVVVVVVCLASLVDGRVFKIGLLAPWDWDMPFSAYTSASAVDIAVEKVHSDPSLNANGRIQLR